MDVKMSNSNVMDNTSFHRVNSGKENDAIIEVNSKIDANVLQQKSQNDEDEQELNSISEKGILDAVEKANTKLESTRFEFRFSVHKATKRINIKVINQETKEIIREIPPEKILDMVAKIWEMSGIFVDEKR